MELNVFFPLVLVGKFGKEPNVFAQLAFILMIRCVLNVLTDKLGTEQKRSVLVKMVINGMDNIAKEPTIVLKIEFGMKLSNNVFAKRTIIGVVMLVFLSQIVKEDNFGIQF